MKLAQKAKKINVRLLALGIAQKNSGLISNSIREQLTEGKAGDGGIVGRYKSDYYVRKYKGSSKAPRGVVNLFLNGDLYKGITSKVLPTQYLTNSLVDHSKYQVDRYGKRIYELQKENSKDIKQTNSRDTVKAYKQKLGL